MSIICLALFFSKHHYERIQSINVSFYYSVKMAGTMLKGWICSFPAHSHTAVQPCQKTNLYFVEIRHQALQLHCRGDETVFWSKVKEGKEKSIVGKCQRCSQNLLGKSR